MQFSIIIPTFSRPTSLRRCLDALKAVHFDFSQFEVIVVDDGSPMELLAGYLWSPLQLTMVRQSNQGPGAARNRGAAVARGRFLLFIDDDCLVVPDFLVHYQKAFERDPEALWGGAILTDPRLNCYCRAAQAVSDMVSRHFNRDADAARFFSSNNLGLARQHMLASQGFEEVYFRISSEDREFCDRLRQRGFRLRRVQHAAVYHEPPLNLVAYTRMFFRYGRGAYRYQRVRRLRSSGYLSQDAGFHLSLLSHVASVLPAWSPGQWPALLLLLGLWQVANAGGFFYDMLLHQFGLLKVDCQEKALANQQPVGPHA